MTVNNKDVCKEKVFNEIFKSNAQDLFNFLHYKYQDEDQAKDLVQDVFGKLWDNLGNASNRGMPYTICNTLGQTSFLGTASVPYPLSADNLSPFWRSVLYRALPLLRSW